MFLDLVYSHKLLTVVKLKSNYMSNVTKLYQISYVDSYDWVNETLINEVH